jgi:hypothetical protein
MAGNVMSASSRAAPATSHHVSGAYMNKAITTAALGSLAALAVTACGGSTSTAAGSTHPAQNAAAVSSGATCAQASGIIQNLVNAQATLDASQQTEQDDLTYIVALDEAIAIIHVGGPVNAQPRWSAAGSGQLNHELYRFYADASTFTQGDTSMQSNVGSDIAALGADCGISASSSGSGSPAAGSVPASSPSPPAPTMTKQTDIVVFSVSGSGEPTVQYGTGSSTNNPSEGAGPLGDGVYLPWHASMTYDSGALYYAVTAQLQGSGSIQDSVTEVITTWCSGSNPKTENFPLANGSASGGYGIATAEYTGGDTGNAQQAESDAGC